MSLRTILPLRIAILLQAITVAFSFSNQLHGVETAPKPLDPMQHGAAIFKSSCAKCHGEKGEGVEELYADPLTGELNVADLTEVIAETMPEDDPEACVGDDAADVAAYIHKSFYGKVAQTTIKQPREKLVRLTGNQLRQSLSDLYAASTGIVWTSHDRGMKGLYFEGAKLNNKNQRFERTDQSINFNFGHQGPGEGINPKDFCVSWRGALKPTTTGDYELVIDSTCAFACYLGSYQRLFIDNLVQSGEKTEFRRSILLSAARIYPLRINLFQRKRKTDQPPVKIRLAWKPPHGVEQTIPSRNLMPVVAPATFALQTKLPPDDRSYGYDRGISVDKQWDESTTNAALEFAQIAAHELWPSYQKRHRNDADENRSPLRGFLAELASTAFRGPCVDEDRKLYVDEQVDATEDDMQAIKRSLLMILKSPRFLYPMLDADRSVSQRIANRLALTLYDSLPTDNWLANAVRKDELENEEQIRSAARRMVFDDRTRGKTRDFLHEWLNLSRTREMRKDPEAFPGFNQELVADLLASFNAFLDEVVWGASGDYRQLFQADWAYTNQRLADFYGESWNPLNPHAQGLRRSASDPKHRFGVLSHPYLMSRLSSHIATSPIHRGVFLNRYVLGRMLLPPQEAFVPLAPDLHPNLTTRERVELQTSPKNCQVCHTKINALGFTLENFDAVGRYRLTEREREINPEGNYTTQSRETISLNGPRELADFLASSEDAQRAFINRAFQHFVKQPPTAFGVETLEQLTQAFKKSDYNIRELLIEIAVLAARDSHESSEQEKSDETPDNETRLSD